MTQQEITTSIILGTLMLLMLVVTLIISIVAISKRNAKIVSLNETIVSLNETIDNLNAQLFPPLTPLGTIVIAAMVGHREFVDANGNTYFKAVLTETFLKNTQFIFIRYYNDLDIRELHMVDIDKNLAVISRPLEMDFKVITIDEIWPVNTSVRVRGYVDDDGIFHVLEQLDKIGSERFVGPDSIDDNIDETDVD